MFEYVIASAGLPRRANHSPLRNPVQPSGKKYSASVFRKSMVSVSPSCLAKRGGSRSSRTSGGMRWTRAARLTSALVCGRRSRVVLAPLCRRQVRKTPTRRADDGVNKAIGPRGEHGVSRKTIAWGMPECFRCLAVNTGVHIHYHYAHTRLRVHWAPGIPRALCLMRARDFLASPRGNRCLRA